MLDDPIKRSNEVRTVNPGHVLLAPSNRSAESLAAKVNQSLVDPAVTQTHDHRAAKRYLASLRRVEAGLLSFPIFPNLDAEIPVPRNIGFLPP